MVSSGMVQPTREKDTHARGKMTAQPAPPMAHWRGIIGSERAMIMAMVRKETRIESQKRLKIFGTSLKKLENSTSFFVAAQVMLYENK